MTEEGAPCYQLTEQSEKRGPCRQARGAAWIELLLPPAPPLEVSGGPLLFRACTSEREERGRQRACLIRPFLTEAGNLPGRQLCGSCLSSDKNKQIGKTIFLLGSSEFYSCSGPGGILFTRSRTDYSGGWEAAWI